MKRLWVPNRFDGFYMDVSSVNAESISNTAYELFAKVGTSTSPTSTGTKAVTGVGFEPKVVMPFGVHLITTGASVEATLGLGCGLSTSSRASIAASSRNSVTTTSTRRRHTSSKVITSVSTITSAEFVEADLSSFDADGFTYNWTLADGAARFLNHIALGGSSLEASLVQCQMNNTNAAQSFAHGLSGAPTGLLFFSAVNSTAPPNTNTGMWMSIGGWSASGNFCGAVRSGNSVTTTSCQRILKNNANVIYISSTAVARSMVVSSVDFTNVSVTYPDTASAYQPYFWMLAIRGAKCQTGTFDCNGSTDPLTISCAGITPKLFLPVFVPVGVDSINTVLSNLLLSIGASDGTNNVSCGIMDQNGVTTTNARRFQSSTTLCDYGGDGSKNFEALASFSGESVILDPSINASSSHGQGGYLIIGE